MPDPRIIQQTFHAEAPVYRWIDRCLRHGWDGLRREKLARVVAKSGTREVLDLGCGSGGLTFALGTAFRRHRRPCALTGVDFCEPLLALARENALRRPSPSVTFRFVQGDLLRLPFPNASFETAVMAFGLRYLESRPPFLAEALRVLKPGGRLFILESAQRPWVARFLMPLIPFLAKLTSSDPAAYRHIAESFKDFPVPAELDLELVAAGFWEARHTVLFGGNLAIHEAKRA